MSHLYREGGNDNADTEQIYSVTNKEYSCHTSAALVAEEDVPQLQSTPNIESEHNESPEQGESTLHMIQDRDGNGTRNDGSIENLHNEYAFAPENYPQSHFGQLSHQELQLHQQAVQEHMMQFQQFQNIQQTQQALYDQVQQNTGQMGPSQGPGGYQHAAHENHHQPQSNTHPHNQQHHQQHHHQQHHLHQQQQSSLQPHIHHHTLQQNSSQQQQQQHIQQHQLHHQQMQQIGMNRQTQGASSLSTEDQAAVVSERKKSKTLYPWLEVSGPACLSERQEARLSEQANVSKKYKNMRCTYCMKFNPVTPWASMRPRKYEMSSLQDHANSAHHQKSERLREESMHFPAMVPTVVYQIQDEVVPGRQQSDASGLPGKSASQIGKPQQQQQQYGRNKRSLSEMTKTHATRGALRPTWLHTEGGLIFSDRQLNDPARPAGLVRKYQMMMCTLCALHSPRSPWASMKSRKFEARLLAEHELSTHHQKSLSIAASPSLPAQHSLQATPSEANHVIGATNNNHQGVVVKSTGGVEARYAVQSQPINIQQQHQQQQQQHISGHAHAQLLGQNQASSQGPVHSQAHSHSMFLHAQQQQQQQHLQQQQLLAQQRQQQLQQIHAHQLQQMHHSPFNSASYSQHSVDNHFADHRAQYYQSQHESSAAAAAAASAGYSAQHYQQQQIQQLHQQQQLQQHQLQQQQQQQYLSHMVESPHMMYAYGATEGTPMEEYDEATDQTLFYPDHVEQALYETQMLALAQGHNRLMPGTITGPAGLGPAMSQAPRQVQVQEEQAQLISDQVAGLPHSQPLQQDPVQVQDVVVVEDQGKLPGRDDSHDERSSSRVLEEYQSMNSPHKHGTEQHHQQPSKEEEESTGNTVHGANEEQLYAETETPSVGKRLVSQEADGEYEQGQAQQFAYPSASTSTSAPALSTHQSVSNQLEQHQQQE